MKDKPFKVGDKVAVIHRNKFQGSAMITKITPTGKIRTNDNRLYKPNGKLITSDVWSQTEIVPWSDEHTQIILKIRVGALFGKVLPAMTIPQLRELKALLDRFKGDKEAEDAPR